MGPKGAQGRSGNGARFLPRAVPLVRHSLADGTALPVFRLGRCASLGAGLRGTSYAMHSAQTFSFGFPIDPATFKTI
jgi:hypothetical protein